MPHFNPGGGVSPTFGRNEYLRSTENRQFRSYTVSSAAFPVEKIGDDEGQKFLQAGEVMVTLTGGPEAGKSVPFQTGGANGADSLTGILGLNDSFEPWRLNNGDIEAGIMYHGAATQGWCTIRDASGKRVPMTDAVANAMRSSKTLDILFF